LDSIIIYEIFLPSLVKVLESEQFHQDLTLIYKPKSQDLSDFPINMEASTNNKHGKPKKHSNEKENKKRLNEAHKAYFMILVYL